MKIYICNLEKTNFFDSYNNFFPRLPEEDQKRITRFARAEDRARGVAGTLLIRMMASDHLGHDNFQIERDEYGKPYLPGTENFFFSLSHSGSYAVSVCGRTPVGIDVETCTPHDIHTFRRIFKDEDLSILNSSSDQLKDFYRIWTSREAWSKKLGKGLSLFDEDFRVSYEDSTISYEGNVSSFTTYDLGGHLMSVCYDDPMEVQDIYNVSFSDLCVRESVLLTSI